MLSGGPSSPFLINLLIISRTPSNTDSCCLAAKLGPPLLLSHLVDPCPTSPSQHPQRTLSSSSAAAA